MEGFDTEFVDTEIVIEPSYPIPCEERWQGVHGFDSSPRDVEVTLMVLDAAYKTRGESLEVRLTHKDKCLATLLPGESFQKFREEFKTHITQGRYALFFYKQ